MSEREPPIYYGGVDAALLAGDRPPDIMREVLRQAAEALARGGIDDVKLLVDGRVFCRIRLTKSGLHIEDVPG